MELKQLQKKVDDYISQFEEGYFPPLSNLARLIEETGELARELNHTCGPKRKKESESQECGIKEEMGDILFTLAVLANQLDVNLDEAVNGVLAKYQIRDLKRWTLKSPLEEK
jgi:NTP pyrophosphatase (non-canonical NTP hydrolase)